MPKRSYPKKSDQRRTEAKHASEVRACCPTNRGLPHLPYCIRPTGRCADKVGFPDRDVATRRAKELSVEHGLMTVYRCQGCRLWHFGHPRAGEAGL